MASNHKFSKQSEQRLTGLNPKLVQVVRLALQKTKQDFLVLEGLRTPQRQRELYNQGRTTPGKIVTWTMKSNHLTGNAVDLVPYPVDWNTVEKFDQIALAMFSAANELGIKIRWGADWDMDGKSRERGESDSPHFELA